MSCEVIFRRVDVLVLGFSRFLFLFFILSADKGTLG
jgi:hypothetical protein